MNTDNNKSIYPSLNFQVFYRIFSRRKMGLVACSLIIIFSFLEINLFIFEAYRRFLSAEDFLIDFFETFSFYVYSTNYLTYYGHTVYNILRYGACLINIAYLAAFLIMRGLISRGITVQGVERIFEIFNTYYTQIIVLPVFEILFRDIFCDPIILEEFGQQCFQGLHIFTFTFALVSLSAGITMVILTVYYSLNGLYDKKNYFSGENKLWETLICLLRILLPIMIINGHYNNTFLYASLSILLCFSAFLILYFMIFLPYNKSFVELLTLGWLVVFFTQSLSWFVLAVSQNRHLDADYMFIFFTITGIPGFIYLYKVLKRRLITKEHTSSPQELLRQIQVVLQLKHSDNTINEEEIYFRGLIARHKTSCHSLRCFCKQDELYDSKKNKDFEPEKWPILKSLILKCYARYLFEAEIEKGTNEPDLLVSYAEFLFQKFRNSHLAQYQIIRLLNSNKFLYPHQRFRIFRLQQKIASYITMRNLEALDKSMEIENVIFIEEQLEKVLQGMKKIIFSSMAFWSYLHNKDIDLDKLKTLAEDMHKSVEETTKLWGPLKAYLYKQKKIMYYYNWFLKDFLQKKIILNEEEVDDLFENDVASVYSNEFLNTLKDDHVLFQADTAVVHMSGNYNDLGRIIKTNKAAMNMFGYPKSELERSNVDILMPGIISHRHGYYLNSYIITGKSKLLYAQKKTFAKDKTGFIMPIWIVVKQLNNSEGQIQYAGLLRPLSQKKDENNYYILLNYFGEVSGVTKNLTEFLQLPGSLFQKLNLNLILLAPKLIRNFFFAKIIQQDKAASAGAMSSTGFLNRVTNSVPNPQRKSRNFYDTITPFTLMQKKHPLKVFMEMDELKEDDAIEKHEVEDKEKEDDDGEESEEEITAETEDCVEIDFTLRIPRKLRSYMKEFNQLKARHHELLNNQQFLLDAISKRKINKDAVEKESAAKFSPTDSPKSSPRKRLIGQMASFKHAVDAYVAALKMMADKIMKSGENNVYRIKGIIVTDYYGPDKDVIKYIKILEIVQKVHKFTHMSTDIGSKANTARPTVLSKKNTEESGVFMANSSVNNIQTTQNPAKSRKSIKVQRKVFYKD